MIDWNHQIKRAILFLLFVLVLAWAVNAHEASKTCYIAHLNPQGHAYLTPVPCKPSASESPATKEKQLTKPQPPKVGRT